MDSSIIKVKLELEQNNNTILFICLKNLNKSFILKLNKQDYPTLTLKEVYIQGNDQFKQIHKDLKIYPRSFQCFYSSEYQNKNQLLINSVYHIHPVLYFEYISDPSYLPTFQIFIWPSTINRTLTMDCKSTTLIGEIKDEIEDIIGFKFDDQRCIYAGSVAEDRDSLHERNIQKESTIRFLVRFRGGQCNTNIESKFFVDLENENLKQIKEFSKDAPDYRIVDNGINIEGYCENVDCEYYDKLVICNIGYKLINVIHDIDNRIKCPNYECQKKINLITCGFFNCFYKWIGVKVLDKNEQKKFKCVKSCQLIAGDEKYTRYNEINGNNDGSINLVEWKSLFLIAESLHYGKQRQCIVCKKYIDDGDGNNEMITNFEDCLDRESHKCHKLCLDTIQQVLLIKKCHLCMINV